MLKITEWLCWFVWELKSNYQQQPQVQPQPGSSGLQVPRGDQQPSNSDSDSDSNSDSQLVHLGGGHACHVSKWVRHCNGEEVDLFGSDAEDEYVEPQLQPDDKEIPTV